MNVHSFVVFNEMEAAKGKFVHIKQHKVHIYKNVHYFFVAAEVKALI